MNELHRLLRARLFAPLAAASLLVSGLTAYAQPAVEKPPVLKASALLSKDMLAGPLFTVDDKVATDGLLAHFTLRSSLGTFSVPGRELLRVRIAELQAIEQLDKVSNSSVFLEAAGKAAMKPIDAAVDIVTNPVDTVEAIPAGFGRLFDRFELGYDNIAHAAKDSSKSGEQRTGETLQRLGSTTINVLGFEQGRRELANSLGVDPYTTNPVLSKKLDDVAWVAFSGRVGVNVLVSMVVPGSMAISATSFTHDLVNDTPAADLIVINKKKMLALGASEAQAQALLTNRWYSLSVLTALVTELERLQGVAGRPEVIALAATAKNEEEARFLAASVGMLARLSVTGIPLSRVAARGTVIGYTQGGAIVVPAPLDYISWTDRVSRFASRSDLQGGLRGIWLTGRMSAQAHLGLTENGWALNDTPLVWTTW